MIILGCMDKNCLFTRRHFLKLCLPIMASMGAVISAKSVYTYQQNQVLNHLRKSFPANGKKSLKEHAAAKGLIYGSAARYDDLTSHPQLAKVFAQECGILVPEWELKWSCGNKLLRPSPYSFDFKPADWMAEFAKKHNILFRGHTLVWHRSLPPWFEQQVNRQNAESFLVNHIKTVVGHYAGKIHSWDVVNEAIAPRDQRPDNLRKTPWLEFLGKDYIELAFRLAAQSDPKALLVYNEYGLDYDTNDDEVKRNAVLNLLQHLKSKGTPIHALGIQGHLSGEQHNFNPEKFREFLRNVASLGLKILITEMDVTDKKLPKDIITRDRIVAGVYHDYLSTALDERAVIAVLTWGLSDGYTWLAEFQPRSDGARVRPLPLDANLNRTLAWNAIANAFDHAPPRS